MKQPSHTRLLFPVLLIVILAGFTLFKISGSSVSVYTLNYGPGKDSNILAGEPKGVRSDEWLVNTQMIVAQAQNNFERVNDKIADGQDMSLIADVPYKDWSTIFKPQNLVFFVLPLEYAFAFKWWVLVFLLMLACYIFLLEIFPDKPARSALISLFVGFTPMVFWWYQSATILPLAYSFLIMSLVIRLLKAANTKSRLRYALLLSYILICFSLILYPPFQIACALIVCVFMVGWLLESYTQKELIAKTRTLWPYFLLIIVTVCAFIGLFFATRMNAINTITNTVYPGSRVVKSGGMEPLQVFSSFLSPNLQFDEKAANGYLRNQSEASNFILIAPFLLIPSLYIAYRSRQKNRKQSWVLVLVNAAIILLLLRMLLHTPWLEPVYQLLLLDKVPVGRLLIGLGFAGILQLVFTIRHLDRTILQRTEIWVLSCLGGLSSLVAMLLIGRYTIHHFPVFIASQAKVLVFSLWIASGIFFILQRRFNIGLALLVCFSFFSIYKVHPLYIGLDPLTNSSTIQAIESYPEEGSWVVLDDRLLINFPLMTGRDSLNSVNFYPQLSLWRELDGDTEHDFIYNRFAHVVFSEDTNKQFELVYADLIKVQFDACSSFIQKKVTYALTPKRLKSPCAQIKQSIELPNHTLYIYKVMPGVIGL